MAVPSAAAPDEATGELVEDTPTPAGTRRLLIAGFVALIVVQTAGFLTIQGVVARVQTTTLEAPWRPATALIAFLVVLAAVPETRRRWPTEGRALKPFLLVAGGLVVGLAFTAAALVAAQQGSALGMRLATAGAIVALAPLAAFDASARSRVKRLEERFPDFLRDLNEAHKASLTMSRALDTTARGHYGALGPEVKRLAAQVRMGVPYQEALRAFSDRVDTPLVRRSVHVVVRAAEVGGDVAAVLASTARDARETLSQKSERRVTMLVYVLVVYVAFAVFLAVVAALQGVFVPAMLDAAQGAGMGIGGISLGRVGLETYRDFFYAAGFVQAIGSGVMAGMLAEGGIAAGLKHVVLMLGLTLVVLGFLL